MVTDADWSLNHPSPPTFVRASSDFPPSRVQGRTVLEKRGEGEFPENIIRTCLATAIIVAIGFIPILPCRASSVQGSTELAFILSYNPMQNTPGVKSSAPLSKGGLGIKSLFVSAIRFYQLFISPQDKPVCNFVPSCSQFGVEAIKQLGVLRGILLTSDRLQRCNGMSTSRYQVDYNSGKLIDPIQIYCEILQ